MLKDGFITDSRQRILLKQVQDDPENITRIDPLEMVRCSLTNFMGLETQIPGLRNWSYYQTVIKQLKMVINELDLKEAEIKEAKNLLNQKYGKFADKGE